MPTGVPEHANAKISKEVKSGLLNFSISNSLGQGNSFIISSALSTKFPSNFDSS